MRTVVRNLSIVSCLSLATGWIACSGSVTEKNEEPSQSTSQLMRRATSCEDLEAALKADARARLERLMMEQDHDTGYAGAGGSMGMDAGSFAGSGGAMTGGSGGAMAGGMGGGTAGGGGGNESGPEGGGPNQYTGTNTQVANVDEADFVKTDGLRIYQLRDQMLHISKAWPVTEASAQSSIQIEGTPLEMFLVGDAGSPDQKLVVYSTVDGYDLFQQAGLEIPTFSGTWDPSGWTSPDPNTSPTELTKISVISVASASPALVHEVYFEGRYTSSRRNGLHVRTVMDVPGRLPELRVYPTEYEQQKAEMLVVEELLKSGKSVEDIPADELDMMVREALGKVMVKENELIIEGIRAQDWLPHVFSKSAGQIVASSVACQDFYVPKPGTSQYGITHVEPLDLGDLGASPAGLGIVGVAQTMYENANAMVLATSTMEGSWSDPFYSTYVHRFELGEGALPTYSGSGVIPGYIKGQFSIDEKNGFIRIVATAGRQWGSEPLTTYLSTLEKVDGELKVAGQTEGFGYMESVYVVRFVGDTAYVVTFRQTDP
ncbi:MAG TPA: beta-propeller domain-containing protein, partial [Polyangiaceae bacterium]|nr:beta-propeller domain-containing protein [Polyangiaceae bacterium]